MISAQEIAEALDVADVSGRPVALEPPRRRCAATGVPVFGRVREAPCTTWADAFLSRTLAVEDGHVEWTGPLTGHGTPLLRIGLSTETAYRYAFRIHYGREAEGRAAPRCGYPHCVAGGHLEDRLLREARLRAERHRAD